MSLLFQVEGFFTEGEMKMVQNPQVHYTSIDITTNGLIFEGKNVSFPKIRSIKKSAGFHLELPWSQISSVYKSKSRLIHVVKIETNSGKFYSIVPLDDLDHFIKKSKKNSLALTDTINKARIQVTNSQQKFCPSCGEKLKPDSDFCGNCGHKL